MDKKKIKTLVLASYKNNLLDKGVINKITSFLNRSDLKQYINGLKAMESKKNLIVIVPFTNISLETFEKLFPNKKIVFEHDPSLMVGLKIQDGDVIYNFNLKDTLYNLISHIYKSL